MAIGLDWLVDYDAQTITHTAGHAITAVSQASSAQVTITGHGFSNGDKIYISSVVGMTELNGNWYLVANSAANTFTLQDLDGNNVNSTGYTAYSSGGTAQKVYHVNELYTYVQDTFDELVQLDDDVPMSAQTPTEYSLIDGWTWGAEAEDVKWLKGGAVTLVDTVNGNDVWANVYSVGTLPDASTQIYVAQNGTVLTPWWSGGHIDILVKVKTDGVLTDSGNLIVYARELGDRYTYFDVAAPSGRQVAAISTENDINDDETGGAVAGVTLAYVGGYADDFASGGTYDYQVDCGGNTLEDVYHYLKYLTRRGSTTSINGVEGQQYLGVDPVNYTTIPAAPFGTFAGGTFFAARGVVLTNMAGGDSNAYQLIDSAGNLRVPPTTTNITVNKIVSGDKVGVYRLTDTLQNGGTIDTAEYTTTAADNDTGDGAIVVVGSIAADTPSSGAIRVGTSKKRYTYSSWSGSTFTLNSTDHPTGLEENQKGVNAFVPLIEAVSGGVSIAATFQHVANDPILVRVRRYNGAGDSIEPFQIESAISENGTTVSAIRNEDTIVS